MVDDAKPKFPAIAVWNIAFMRGPRQNWWDWLTEPEWRHVCAFGYSVTADAWVIYDVADTHSRISVVDGRWMDRWFDTNAGRFTAVLKVHTKPGDLRSRLGLWCVTAVKHLVGSRSSALRPHALYRDLLASGAEPAFEEIYGRESETSAGGPGDQGAA